MLKFSQAQIDGTRRVLKRSLGRVPKLVDVFWSMQRGCCALCGYKMDRRHPNTPNYRSIDHIVPTSRGGSNNESNKRLAHRDCNTVRGNQLDAEMEATANRVEEIRRRFLARDIRRERAPKFSKGVYQSRQQHNDVKLTPAEESQAFINRYLSERGIAALGYSLGR